MSAVLESPLDREDTLGRTKAQQWASGKRGRADLVFDVNHLGKTGLAQQFVEYPFHITRPHYLEADWPEFATLCLQSVSGGLLQGDRVSLSIKVAEGAAAQVTTQASTKVHSMQCDFALQKAEIDLEPGSYLEYLSDPMILFPRTRLHTTVKVRLGEGAKGVVRESFFYHDPKGSTEPLFDRYLSEVRIEDSNGRLLAMDRQGAYFPQDNPELRNMLLDFPYQGAVYILGIAQSKELEEHLNDLVCEMPESYAGVTALPNDCGYYLRLLAKDAFTLRTLHDRIAKTSRKLLVGQEINATWKK